MRHLSCQKAGSFLAAETLWRVSTGSVLLLLYSVLQCQRIACIILYSEWYPWTSFHCGWLAVLSLAADTRCRLQAALDPDDQ